MRQPSRAENNTKNRESEKSANETTGEEETKEAEKMLKLIIPRTKFYCEQNA